MKSISVWGVWLAAILIAGIIALSCVALGHIDDGAPVARATIVREAISILGIALLSQLGLMLAPLVQRRPWPYRAIVALMMIPTFMIALTVGYDQLRSVPFWGVHAFMRIESAWIPIVVLYALQFVSLTRGNSGLDAGFYCATRLGK